MTFEKNRVNTERKLGFSGKRPHTPLVIIRKQNFKENEQDYLPVNWTGS